MIQRLIDILTYLGECVLGVPGPDHLDAEDAHLGGVGAEEVEHVEVGVVRRVVRGPGRDGFDLLPNRVLKKLFPPQAQALTVTYVKRTKLAQRHRLYSLWSTG